MPLNSWTLIQKQCGGLEASDSLTRGSTSQLKTANTSISMEQEKSFMFNFHLAVKWGFSCGCLIDASRAQEALSLQCLWDPSPAVSPTGRSTQPRWDGNFSLKISWEGFHPLRFLFKLHAFYYLRKPHSVSVYLSFTKSISKSIKASRQPKCFFDTKGWWAYAVCVCVRERERERERE